MKAFFKTISLKRKIMLALLACVMFACVFGIGVTTLTNKTETAEATAVNTRLINATGGASQSWTYYSSNSNTLFTASQYGAVFNVAVKPNYTLSAGQHRNFFFGIAPDNSFYWQGSSGFGARTGRVSIELMINGDNRGMYCRFRAPSHTGDGSEIVTGYNAIASSIWPEGVSIAKYAYYNVCIRVVKVNDIWDLQVNQISFNTICGTTAAFATYIGTAWKNASTHKTNFGVVDIVGNQPGYYVYLGSHRAISDTEYNPFIVNEASRWVNPFGASANAYASIYSGNNVEFTEHGGYVDFGFVFTTRPYTGGYPVIRMGFSPNGQVYFHDGDGTLGSTGRFYVCVMINGDNGYVYVSPHFYNGKTDTSSTWKKIAELPNGGVLGIRFKFVARQGGWGFIICDTLETASTTYDFTSDFQTYMTQSNVFTGGTSINVGAAGATETWGSNYASVFWLGSGKYNGYDAKTNNSAILEVLSGSPAERVSYYDDANSHAAGAYITSLTSGFKATFGVKLTSAITDTNYSIQLCFGPDNNIMNADTHNATSTIGNGHFTLVITLHSNGNIYGGLYYRNGTDTWTELAGMEYGKVCKYTKTSGTTFDITVAFRQVNSIAYNGTSGKYGLFVNDVLLDAVNVSGLVTRSPNLITNSNKNIAITVGADANGFADVPFNVYLKSVAADASATSITTPNVATVCDLYPTNRYDAPSDSISAAATAYKYDGDGTSASASTFNSAYVTFEFTGTYNTSKGITVNLNSNEETPTSGVGATINSSGVTFGVYSTSDSAYYSVVRKLTLSNGDYTFRLTLAQSSSNVYVALCIVNSSSTVVFSEESVASNFKVTAANRYVYVGGASSATTITTISYHRALFTNGNTVVASKRYNTSSTTAPAITDAATYCTGYWYKNNTMSTASGVKYASGATITSSTSARYYRHDIMDKTSAMQSGNLNIDAVKFDAGAGIYRKTTNEELSTTVGRLAFMHNIKKAFYDTLQSADDGDTISSFEIYVLIKSSDVSSITFDGATKAILCTALYGTDSSAYAVVGYCGVGVANKSTTLTSCVCIKITQIDGSINYVYGGVKKSTLAQAATNAVPYAATVQQRTAFTAYGAS